MSTNDSTTRGRRGHGSAAAGGKAAAEAVEAGAAAISEHLDALREHAGQAQAAATETAQDLGAIAKRQLRDRPYTTLAVVAATGFVLGGGLAPRLVGTAARYGGRYLLARIVREVLQPKR